MPTGLRATRGRNSIAFGWNPVTQTDTGRPVTVVGYRTMYYSEEDTSVAQPRWGPYVSSGTTATISDLQPGTAYNFAVIAEGEHQRSLSTGWVEFTTLDDFPLSLQRSGTELIDYDINFDGTVDSEEIVAAIEDFDNGLMNQEQFDDLIREYFNQNQ
ncbi:MAG: fibronectin type III domain-containing protein [Chloroflexi bacterium]|nr:fibronectin type III domain-containing protein [Chloroflexota bacterium]